MACNKFMIASSQKKYMGRNLYMNDVKRPFNMFAQDCDCLNGITLRVLLLIASMYWCMCWCMQMDMDGYRCWIFLYTAPWIWLLGPNISCKWLLGDSKYKPEYMFYFKRAHNLYFADKVEEQDCYLEMMVKYLGPFF